jgi:hypothetical protein
MAMFRSYFDASGKEDLGLVVVAGYVAPAKKWAEYQKKWKAALSKHDIPYFRMSELANSVGAFKDGWRCDEPRRRELQNDLIDVVKSTVEYSVACCIKYDDFAAVNREFELKEFFGNAYVLAAWDCIANVNKYLGKKRPEPSDRDVSYVFEAGDEGMGHIVRLAHAHNLPIPEFHPSRPNKRGIPFSVQLQCADFAAYEAFRASQKFRGTPVPREEARMSAQLLRDAIPGWWGIYNTAEDLARTVKNFRLVKKRS